MVVWRTIHQFIEMKMASYDVPNMHILLSTTHQAQAPTHTLTNMYIVILREIGDSRTSWGWSWISYNSVRLFRVFRLLLLLPATESVCCCRTGQSTSCHLHCCDPSGVLSVFCWCCFCYCLTHLTSLTLPLNILLLVLVVVVFKLLFIAAIMHINSLWRRSASAGQPTLLLRLYIHTRLFP